MVQIENDVYSQIGLVMLIGLAAKNAILIVEFAKDKYEHGTRLVDAALEGARLRLRPILMSRSHSSWVACRCGPRLGPARWRARSWAPLVIGGMLAASVLGIFFVPACFYLVEKIAGASREKLPAVVPHSPEPAQGD